MKRTLQDYIAEELKRERDQITRRYVNQLSSSNMQAQSAQNCEQMMWAASSVSEVIRLRAEVRRLKDELRGPA